MILNIVWLILGLLLILFGANWLTDGSSALAKRMGVSDLIIGLTVVAFGTSAPELTISIISAIDHKASLAVGNIVGSNIFNILVIIGMVACIKPIKIEKSIMTNEIPMVIFVAILMLLFGYAPQLDPRMPRSITRVDGILLLLIFTLYLRYTFASAKTLEPSGALNVAQTETAAEPVDEPLAEPKKEMNILKACVLVILGLAALIYGGDRFVDGASAVASAMGVSDAVIGLTIVAIGTSLPELATSVVAAMKGKTGLAVGNVIGSNILNVVLVLGIAATIFPLPFGSISQLDLWVEFGASALFLLMGWLIGSRTITRAEGALLLAGYVAYTAYLIMQAT